MATKKLGFKGHCYMCAMNRGKIKGTRREVDPVATLRLVGRTHRTKRREVPRDQLD